MTTLDFNSVPSDPYANTGKVIYIRTESSYFATYVTIMCRNDELSWTMSCVGCLLTN